MNRYFLTEDPIGKGGAEPFLALNEAFVVFADSPGVITALRKIHEELGRPDRLNDNIVTLIKKMANGARGGVQERTSPVAEHRRRALGVFFPPAVG